VKFLRWTSGVLSACLLGAVSLMGAGIGVANAATVPPWEPDVNGLGTLTLYSATGAVVTSGHLADVPFVSYVRTSAPGRAGDSKATLSIATPDHANPTSLWAVSGLSASTK
jgi:hypothetical protein